MGKVGHLLLAGGDFFFQRADLRLPLEDARLRGTVARRLAALKGTVVGEEFAGEGRDGQSRVLAAEFAGGGEGLGHHAVGEEAVEQRGHGRGRFHHVARPRQRTVGQSGGFGRFRATTEPGGKRQKRRAADLLADGEGVEQFGGHLVVAQEDRLQMLAKNCLDRRDETRGHVHRRTEHADDRGLEQVRPVQPAQDRLRPGGKPRARLR